MAQDKMYKAALEAIDQGQTARARDLFTRLLRTDSSKAEYWLWMSTLVESAQERIYCLESALRVDPNNEAAKRGLIILGAREAGKDVTPIPPVRRKWEKEVEHVAEPPTNSALQQAWNNRFIRYGSIIVAGFVIVGLIIVSLIGPRHQPQQVVEIIKVSPFPTHTPEPTLSPTATRTLVVRSPTPTFMGATPLYLFMPKTYTPEPLYVNTPHPRTEAYRAGISAYEKSDWTSLLQFMQQAEIADPNTADIIYYIAEAYRMQGKYQDAVLEYERAMKSNPRFAPAYLGRALAYEKINPKADIEGELNYAIEYDPNYVDAYLTRARIRIKHNNPTGAIEDLAAVDKLVASNPMVYVLLAQAYLELNDPPTAMKYAQIGFDLDKTSLPAYFTLAKIYLAQNNSKDTLTYIDTYLTYATDDADGWAIKAQAEFQLGNFTDALAATDLGIAANEENAPSWYYRGLIHLDQGESRTAVNDLVNAVKFDPTNFAYNIALGKALWADDRLDQAALQFDGSELIASSDKQLAEVYYNRALVYDQEKNTTRALQDYLLLLALPPSQVPAYWRTYAQERANIINPPTPTEPGTQSPIVELTVTPSPTP
jgi:tetratricopeptide (TPR) repeat protein